MLYGCDSVNTERSIIRFAMEKGFKSACKDDSACVNKIDMYLNVCLTDSDIDILRAMPDSEFDDKASEIGSKAIKCINDRTKKAAEKVQYNTSES